MNKDLKLMFIPVSSPEGMGEYMRSLILAQALADRFPRARIEFLLNRHAPYTAECPFPVTLLDSSPTRATAAVNDAIKNMVPDLVVFDASGRKKQLECAQEVGAAVVFISQHKRKRRRGLRIGRAKVTDLHLVAQPEFIIGQLGWLERLKCAWFKLPRPKNIGAVFFPPTPDRQERLLAELGLERGNFLLFSAGSGGHKWNQGLATDRFLDAAKEANQKTAMPCLLVLGPNYPGETPDVEGVHCLRSMTPMDFVNVLDAATAAVLSGGDTLLQAIALGKPTLAVPVSKDQPARIHRCVEQGLVLSATLPTLVAAAHNFVTEERQRVLRHKLMQQTQENGLHLAMKHMITLIEDRL
ncbi:glycosyltransferase family protein [Shewanella cyperi]|uniref:hypothetical protein n=1 Tax=Shewanella cyperi TaxID=2814292 RepID=UPI001D18FA90|nr:hypothetical protein [Shewanella cyperi]